MEKLKFLLAGNPNVGKSSAFNHLTGLKQHVGNWPGKTVELKSGSLTTENYEVELIDLPGNYSLTPYSVEEQVSRDAIIHEENDAVINVIDAENIQRNLYLTLQIMETGANTVIALNMLNYAEEAGIKINVKKLEKTLGIPIVVIDAREGTGLDELIQTTIKAAKNPVDRSSNLTYGFELDDHTNQVKQLFPNLKVGTAPDTWVAVKLLEGDDEVISLAEESPDKQNLRKVTEIRKHLEEIFDDSIDNAFIDARYGEINSIMKETVQKPKTEKESFTDKVDNIVTHKFWGLIIFFAVIFLTFYVTYFIGGPFQELIELGWAQLSDFVAGALGEGLLTSLIVDGVIGGVGGILTFLPIIFILFFLLSLIEDIGYLARAAFVIDRIMYKLMGLSGKAFIPMMLGLGCGVTGIMSTRTLSNESDRISTMLAIPFISCSARAPIYALFTTAFFEGALTQAVVTLILYIIGMIVAIIVAKIFKSRVFKEDSTPFIMELPPYRIPTLKSAVLHMWERGFLFIKKAGTIILGTSVLVWILANLPPGVEYGSINSIVGMFGNAIAPIFGPLGFGFWQAAVALVFGIMAKEIVVSTFGTLFSLQEDDEEGINGVLSEMFTPLSAISFMVFTLLYVPCFAALGAIKEESNSWKWMLVSVALCCGIAYVVSLVIYQGGLLLGFT